MRLSKSLLQAGLTSLLTLVLLSSFSDSAEARGRGRNRNHQQRQESCGDFLSRDQYNSFFDDDASDIYQSHSNRDRRNKNNDYRYPQSRNDRNRSDRYDRNQNRDNRNRNNDRYRERPQQGYGSTAPFGDIRDDIFAQASKSHRSNLTYSDARERIMHVLDMRQDQRGTYVWDYYCQRAFRLNSNQMPDSNQLNIEHTWPQSRFSTRFPRDQQKTDLHHLYPTNSWANQLRGNMNFGYVQQDTDHTDANCKDSRVGYDKNHQIRFQPPEQHRGSIARSLFYFAIRYKLPIDAEQEAILRQWDKDDPVSQEDIERNNKIEAIQGNRNPFIDDPKLIDSVPNFR